MSGDRPNIFHYLREILSPLEPIIQHGIKMIYVSIIIFITSKLLHYILPPEYLPKIERVELLFYIGVTALFGIYTFILLALNLTVHFIEEMLNKIKETEDFNKRLNKSNSSRFLSGSGNDTEDDSTWFRNRIKNIREEEEVKK